mmetsp:Transcript_2386/g.5569  ORF Transcript_2386/g.5569 Transcript_2386/m.5569 type:complete len:224 (+) Transcript_2386:73-744(+)
MALREMSISICCEVGRRAAASCALKVCLSRSRADVCTVLSRVNLTSSTHFSAEGSTYDMASLIKSLSPFSGDTRCGWNPSAWRHTWRTYVPLKKVSSFSCRTFSRRPEGPAKASRIKAVVAVSFRVFRKTLSKSRHWLKMACVVLFGWNPTSFSSTLTSLYLPSNSSRICGRLPAGTCADFGETEADHLGWCATPCPDPPKLIPPHASFLLRGHKSTQGGLSD